MYLGDYLFFLGATLVCFILSAYANISVKTTYSRYGKVRCRSGMTGYDAAMRIRNAGGAHDIFVSRVGGTLSDHYDPSKSVVNLSDSTYSGDSVAAVAVAAHEMGHVMQKKTGYLFYRIRTFLVPVVNGVSYLSMPLVLIGLLIDYLSLTADPDVGFRVALIGVICYGGTMLFSLVTLPVEFDASRRACGMLVSEGILSEDEMPGAKKVLRAAAFTYVASLLTSMVYFLRFLVRVLTVFGRRDDR